MSAPAVVIRLGMEERPCVVLDAAHEDEARRLDDWLGAHPAWAELIALALALAEQEQAP